ncbi:D-alanine--D-alanine ligase [Aeromicrobium sp. SMF47]|uniref:D-alanine--D-alanine ligase n=1 Tax=Aeromicrobium yanjiei TaxID=2662028 RepID=A0A5Q2MKS5_9ACTN|nr:MULTISPECIES: D-alanine--D-alanine ligase family protein [Aeromicrobium]MRJ77974.1 D-alanine--D-alanine ligase [Aeromicrobium yanjiei]MRK02334.1 D-alanine--D-alanine ligase [Aeromicrobium sp. S22]QGG40945.1 D-alanine--D-alanine ligase [Aeromicrobium yanjiei]
MSLVNDSLDKPRLAVIFGGRSSEHGVSCLTAREILAVIDRDRYHVVPIGITRDGAWVHETAEWDGVPAGTLPSVRDDRPPFAWEGLRDIDVAFPVLHGPWGEDGTIQGLLEMADVRYVGAGVLASAVSMDKPFTKTVFSAAGLPQLPYVTIRPWEWKQERSKVEDRIRALGLPVFVKPARAGSSSGVMMVDSWDVLETAVLTAREFDPKVIVESAARGKRELECAVIQRPTGKPTASVVGEITVAEESEHEFYDFEAKYLDGTSSNVVPADISVTLSERIRAYAVQAFEAVGCEGLARVDFFLTDDGLVINEINTMPGFTPYSMFPRLWEASGVRYADLVDRLIQLGLQRDKGLR